MFYQPTWFFCRFSYPARGGRYELTLMGDKPGADPAEVTIAETEAGGSGSEDEGDDGVLAIVSDGSGSGSTSGSPDPDDAARVNE